MRSEQTTNSILATIARLLNTEVSNLADSDGLGTHPNWDSLVHIEILATLEETCNLTIDEQSIAFLATFGSIREFVREGP